MRALKGFKGKSKGYKGKGKGKNWKGKGKKGFHKGSGKGKGKGKGGKIGKGPDSGTGCFICGSQSHWSLRPKSRPNVALFD